MSKIQYKVVHVGINSENEEQARQLSDTLCTVFNQEVTKETPVSIFCGSIFEAMKHSRRGVHGHIALQTEDVEAAMADLAEKGITFQEDTIKRDANGKICFVYLVQEFGGFSFHLTV